MKKKYVQAMMTGMAAMLAVTVPVTTVAAAVSYTHLKYTERRTGLERLVGIRPDRLVCQPAGERPESFSGIYLQVD